MPATCEAGVRDSTRGHYHRDRDRDHWRDACILGAGGADHVYRFRGTDLWFRIEDCLYLASVWTPVIFGERGRALLSRLATEQARLVAERSGPKGDWETIAYPPRPEREGQEPAEHVSWVFRCHLGDPFWRDRFEFARDAGRGQPLDEVRARFNAKRGY